MDSKPRRTISDIRPARSLDGVTPAGNRRPTQPPPIRPVEAAVTSEVTGEQVTRPAQEMAEPIPAPAVASPVPEPTAQEAAPGKKKGGVLKKILKTIFGLIVLALVAAGGWVVYINYFS